MDFSVPAINLRFPKMKDVVNILPKKCKVFLRNLLCLSGHPQMNNRFPSSRWAKKQADGRSGIFFFFFLISFLYKLECTGQKVKKNKIMK